MAALMSAWQFRCLPRPNVGDNSVFAYLRKPSDNARTREFESTWWESGRRLFGIKPCSRTSTLHDGFEKGGWACRPRTGLAIEPAQAAARQEIAPEGKRTAFATFSRWVMVSRRSLKQPHRAGSKVTE